MSEKDKAIRSLAFWHKVFVVVFINFFIIFTVIGTKFVVEVQAFNLCHGAESRDFMACYEANRR